MKTTISNYNYSVGRSARENWQLLDQAEPFDIWFHLDSQSSPYVILEIRDNNEVPYESLLEGARLCKQYSKAKNDKSVKVIYCPVENLKKGKNLGQVTLSKPPKQLTV